MLISLWIALYSCRSSTLFKAIAKSQRKKYCYMIGWNRTACIFIHITAPFSLLLSFQEKNAENKARKVSNVDNKTLHTVLYHHCYDLWEREITIARIGRSITIEGAIQKKNLYVLYVHEAKRWKAITIQRKRTKKEVWLWGHHFSLKLLRTI